MSAHLLLFLIPLPPLAIIRPPTISILKTTDILPRHNRTNIASDVGYPPHKRYTLQWLEDPGPADTNMIPNNSDATFKKATKKAKPSDLLLHYTYGAAAIRRWGRGTEILTKLATPPRT